MYSEKDLSKFTQVPEILSSRSKMRMESNIVYSWSKHFHDNLQKTGRHFYLNWYHVALIVHCSSATAKRILKELQDFGLFVKNGEEQNGTNRFIVRDWREMQDTVLESEEEYQEFLATLDKVKGSDAARLAVYAEEIAAEVAEEEETGVGEVFSANKQERPSQTFEQLAGSFLTTSPVKRKRDYEYDSYEHEEDEPF